MLAQLLIYPPMGCFVRRGFAQNQRDLRQGGDVLPETEDLASAVVVVVGLDNYFRSHLLGPAARGAAGLVQGVVNVVREGNRKGFHAVQLWMFWGLSESRVRARKLELAVNDNSLRSGHSYG